MPFIDNNASSLLFKNKHDHIVKSTLICGAALASIMVANPITKTTVKADTSTTTQVNTPITQVNTPTTDWIATKPADIHVNNNQKTYTLNRGDTLWAIAQATNTDVNQLAQLNNINLEAGDQYHLAIGLTIKLTADAQTETNRNSNDNANNIAQNSANSNSNNAESTTANTSNTAKTPATTNSNNVAKTTSQPKTSPQNSSATAATGSQSNTNADTTKNGQIDTGKSQVSKPVDVIHNESSSKTSGKPNSQSGILSDGSTNSQTPSSPIDKNSSSKPATDNSKHSASSSNADNTSNDNNSHAASSSTKSNGSTSASSSSKPSSSSTSNAGSGPANIDHDANHSSSSSSSSSSNPNTSSSSSSSKDTDSSNPPSSSSSDDNSDDTSNISDYKQTAPLNNNDLTKVVALEKQINDLKNQANTIDNNLQFYQDFIDATKSANGTNPQDRLDKIAFQNVYYQKTVNGYSDMSDEQTQLATIKAQLPIDNQIITNLQNQLTKPDITDNKKQTLTTDLNNAKATAVKNQETYQTLQAKINWASGIVAQYKTYLARNADMTAALKGNGQANSLVAQYQKYINDNQNTQANLDTQIADTIGQLKAYGVTLNS